MKTNHLGQILVHSRTKKFIRNCPDEQTKEDQQKFQATQKGFLSRERMKYIVLKEQENVPSSTPEKEMAAFGDWLAKHQKYCHLSKTTKFKQPSEFDDRVGLDAGW